MALPGDPGRGRQNPSENAAITNDADDRKQEGQNTAIEQGERRQVSKVAKHQSAGAHMHCATGQNPGQSSAEDDTGQGRRDEFPFAPRTQDSPQDQQRWRIRRQMLERHVEKWPPEDPRQAAQMPGNDAVLRQLTLIEQVIRKKNQPAERGQG